MKKKVYNKKKFLSGIIFLLLASISIPGTIIRLDDLNTLRIIKYIILDTFCVLFGMTEVYRSLSSKCTKKDKQNDDERESLIDMKSKTTAFKITFFICVAVTILSEFVFGITKNNVWMGIFIGMGIFLTIMMIAEISSYIYHNKQN